MTSIIEHVCLTRLRRHVKPSKSLRCFSSQRDVNWYTCITQHFSTVRVENLTACTRPRNNSTYPIPSPSLRAEISSTSGFNALCIKSATPILYPLLVAAVPPHPVLPRLSKKVRYCEAAFCISARAPLCCEPANLVSSRLMMGAPPWISAIICAWLFAHPTGPTF
eukprot:1502521-Rhodomonas_salina.2